MAGGCSWVGGWASERHASRLTDTTDEQKGTCSCGAPASHVAFAFTHTYIVRTVHCRFRLRVPFQYWGPAADGRATCFRPRGARDATEGEGRARARRKEEEEDALLLLMNVWERLLDYMMDRHWRQPSRCA